MQRHATCARRKAILLGENGIFGFWKLEQLTELYDNSRCTSLQAYNKARSQLRSRCEDLLIAEWEISWLYRTAR